MSSVEHVLPKKIAVQKCYLQTCRTSRGGMRIEDVLFMVRGSSSTFTAREGFQFGQPSTTPKLTDGFGIYSF